MFDYSKIGDWSSQITDRARDDYWKERSENQLRSNMEYNRQTQEDFAKYGIQMRVADAQAAGVHPLYALGGGAPTFSPGASVSEGGAQSQPLSGSSQLYETQEQRQLRIAQMESIKASAGRDNAQAAYYDAMAAIERQKLNPGPRTLLNSGPESSQGDVVIPSWDVNNPGNVDAVKLSGDPRTATQSYDSSMGASEKNAFWREYQVTPDGFRMALPWTQEGPGEALENVSWWMWPSVIRMNAARYGGDWLGQFISQVVMGARPEYRHATPTMGKWNNPDPELRSSGRERGVNWRRPNRETSYRWNVK